MKNGVKIVLFGSVILSCGMVIGFKSCQRLLLLIVHDTDFLSRKIVPAIEKKIGSEKLEKIQKILEEK